MSFNNIEFADISNWKEQLALYRKAASRKNGKEEAISLTLELHKGKSLFYAEITKNLTIDEFAFLPKKPKTTIAWVLWQLMRIEDMISNILINESDQIFDANWQKRMRLPITDTANALTKDELLEFSKQLDMEAVLEYRDVVERRTRNYSKFTKTSN